MESHYNSLISVNNSEANCGSERYTTLDGLTLYYSASVWQEWQFVIKGVLTPFEEL